MPTSLSQINQIYPMCFDQTEPAEQNVITESDARSSNCPLHLLPHDSIINARLPFVRSIFKRCVTLASLRNWFPNTTHTNPRQILCVCRKTQDDASYGRMRNVIAITCAKRIKTESQCHWSCYLLHVPNALRELNTCVSSSRSFQRNSIWRHCH